MQTISTSPVITPKAHGDVASMARGPMPDAAPPVQIASRNGDGHAGNGHVHSGSQSLTLAQLLSHATRLADDDLERLHCWLGEYRAADAADRWDMQIAVDIQSGRLDRWLDAVEEDITAGRTTPLPDPGRKRKVRAAHRTTHPPEPATTAI